MALRKIQHKLPDVLRETITSLCRNMVDFQDDLVIEGLLGVTLDSTQIFLVPVNERLTKGHHKEHHHKEHHHREHHKEHHREHHGGDTANSPLTIEDTPKKEKLSKKERKRRRAEELESNGPLGHVVVESKTPSPEVSAAPVNSPDAKMETEKTEVIPDKAPEMEENDNITKHEPGPDVSLDTSLELPPESDNEAEKDDVNKADDGNHDNQEDDEQQKPQDQEEQQDDSKAKQDDEEKSPKTENTENTDEPKTTSADADNDDAPETNDKTDAEDPEKNDDAPATSKDDEKAETTEQPENDTANPLEVLKNECEQLQSDLKILTVWSDSPAIGEENGTLENGPNDKESADIPPLPEAPESLDQDSVEKMEIPDTPGFEVLTEEPATPKDDDDPVPSCSKDADAADAGPRHSTPILRKRKNKSYSEHSGSSDSSDSDDSDDEEARKRRKRMKKSPKSKADRDYNPDSPKSTGSEVEFVAMDTDSSKKKRRKSKESEDLIILDDNDSKNKGGKKRKDLEISALIAGVVKTTMGNFQNAGKKQPKPGRALGTITPVPQGVKSVPTLAQQLTCQFCGHKFNNMRLLSQHRQMDKCTMCGALFNCPTLRFNHVVRDHQGGASMVPSLPSRGRARGRGQRGGLSPLKMSMPRSSTPISSQMSLSNFMNASPSTSTTTTQGGKNFRVVTAKKCRECGGLFSVDDFERHHSECPALVSKKKKKHMCGCGVGYRHSKNFNAHIDECTIAQALGTAKIKD